MMSDVFLFTAHTPFTTLLRLTMRLMQVMVRTMQNSIRAAADAYEGYPPLLPYSMS